ncbi:hypothetical protein GQ457_11G020100 [Hibiscus cannabinus]
MGGKEVFIKSVLQSLPTFAMSIFLLPITFCRELENMAARFWWQKSHAKKGIHWCTWSALCRLKEDGGMGFRDFAKFNIALLAKQGWRLLDNPGSLVARVYRAKYYHNSNFLKSTLGSNPSLTWRSIWSAKKLILSGLRWRVGSGTSISIWEDFWLNEKKQRLITTPRIEGLQSVADLIHPSSNTWNHGLISEIFSEEDADSILSIPLASNRNEDKLIWYGEPTGKYSVRSGYKGLFDQLSLDPINRFVFYQTWRLKSPAKVKIFLWKCMNNYLPTSQNFSIKRVTNSSVCSRCMSHEESLTHVFRDCCYAANLWSMLHLQWPNEVSNACFPRWMQWLFEHNRCFSKEFLAISLWALWSARNKFIFEGVPQSTSDLLTFIRAYCFEYQVMSTILDHPNPQKEIRWSPPNPPLVKVNVDAKFVQELKKAWSGIVIRDGNGDILGACVRIQNYSPSPFSAEAWAVVHGLQFWRVIVARLSRNCNQRMMIIRSFDHSFGMRKYFQDIFNSVDSTSFLAVVIKLHMPWLLKDHHILLMSSGLKMLLRMSLRSLMKTDNSSRFIRLSFWSTFVDIIRVCFI